MGYQMELKTIKYNLSVCKVTDISDIDLTSDFYFAVSTYNTDYIFVKEENFERSLEVLINEGYKVI